MRLGGDKYQQAFYVFEELAQSASTASVRSLVAQAVAELHLGRAEEAEVALRQAIQKDPNCVDAVANLLVLSVVTGKDPSELKRYVVGPMPCMSSVSRLTHETVPSRS